MIVESPDGKSIDFPESMSKDQVTSAMQRLYPPKKKEPEVSTTMDVLKGAGSGLVEGALAPFDLAANAGNYLGEKAANLFTSTPSKAPPMKTPSEQLGVDYDPKTTSGKVAKFVGAAAPIGAEAIGAGSKIVQKGAEYVNEHFPKSVIPNADELRSIGSGLYKKAAELGGKVKPEASDKFIEDIQKLKPQTELGKAYAGESAFTQSVDKLATIMKGKPVSLDEAQELDELLGDEIDAHVENGQLNKQGKKLLDVQSAFRNMIENAPPEHIVGGAEGFKALQQARQVWAASRRAADIERIVSRAENTQNPATAIKSGFNALLHNPSRMRGFSAEEKEAIQKAAESGIASDLLGIVGSRLNPIIGWASGTGLGGEAALTGASMAARGAKNAVQVNRAKNVTNLISKNAMDKAGIPLETAPRFPKYAPQNEGGQ